MNESKVSPYDQSTNAAYNTAYTPGPDQSTNAAYNTAYIPGPDQSTNAAYNTAYTPGPDQSTNAAYNTAYIPGPGGVDMNAPPAYGANSVPIVQHQVYTATPVVVGVNQHVMYRQGEVPPMPQNYIIHNVMVLLFCCFVFGIIGIVKGTQVNNLYITGNYAAAEEASQSARRWYVWGLGIGLVLVCGLFVLFMCLILI